MKSLRVGLCILACAVALAMAGQARAETVAVEINTYTAGTNYAFSVGWTFIPTEDIIITKLGLIDGLNDGVDNLEGLGGQPVALFESPDPFAPDPPDPTAGARLRYAIVPTTATAEAAGNRNAYYVAIEPITLTAGKRYLVAAQAKKKDFVYNATFLNDGTKPFTRVSGHATPAAGPSTMPLYANKSTFTIGPTANGTSYYGGTFKFVPVPEPSGGWLLVAGALALVAWRRTR